jgi:acetylornithine/succinyldiaminopimelate/putrescine aminotransferase
VLEVRGSGLMLGIELDAADAPAVATAALAAGLVVGTAGPTVLRLTPPLTISNAECDRAVDVLATILASRETER